MPEERPAGGGSGIGAVREMLAIVVGYAILSSGALALHAIVGLHRPLLALLGGFAGMLAAALAGYLAVAMAGHARAGPALGLGVLALGAFALMAFGAHTAEAWRWDGALALLLGSGVLGGRARERQIRHDRTLERTHEDRP